MLLTLNEKIIKTNKILFQNMEIKSGVANTAGTDRGLHIEIVKLL